MKFRYSWSKSSSKHAVVDFYHSCKKENCGLVSMKGKFLVTFILSILSSAFGVGKFLKNGPMTLVPRERYGPSFVLGTFFVALNLVYKGIMLGASFGNLDDPIKAIFMWFSTFLLPQFVYVSLKRFIFIFYYFLSQLLQYVLVLIWRYNPCHKTAKFDYYQKQTKPWIHQFTNLKCCKMSFKAFKMKSKA